MLNEFKRASDIGTDICEHILDDSEDIPLDGNDLISMESESEQDESKEEDESEESGVEELDVRSYVMDAIQQIVLNIYRQMAQNDSESPKITIELADRTKANADRSIGKRTLCYPRGCKSRISALKQIGERIYPPYLQVLHVLKIIYLNVKANSSVTKRDIYYDNVELFGSQAVIDRLVDDISATLTLDRGSLGIKATSKGLVCGSSLTLILHDGVVMNGSDTDGIIIPSGQDLKHIEISSDLTWVLVVEKDAVFQNLSSQRVTNHPSIAGKGILITGKGYPDLATRHLVRVLSDNLPESIPILGLFDSDPYGLDILSVYKYGSFSMRHQNDSLSASRLKWLGVYPGELQDLILDRDELLTISKHDHSKALKMLTRGEEVMPTQYRRELMHMLHSRRKAEIEILSNVSTAGGNSPLLEYLARKIEAAISVDTEVRSH